MQSHRQSQLCANMMYHESDLGQAGYPNLKCLHGKIWPRLGHISVWQTGLSALAGHSTYHEPWVPVNIFFLSILMVRLFHIRYFENGPLAPGYPSCKRDQIKMRDYMGMWVTPPTWGPPLPCKQALDLLLFCRSRCRPRRRCLSSLLLWSRNFATMVTWGHTSPLYGGGIVCVEGVHHRISQSIHPFSGYFPCTPV